MNPNIQKTALYLASALLLQKKEISVEDIKSIPFITSSDEAEAVISFLRENFKTEIYLKKISSQPILEWEEIIRLK